MKHLAMHGKNAQMRTTKDNKSENEDQIVNKEFSKKTSYKKIKELFKKK